MSNNLPADSAFTKHVSDVTQLILQQRIELSKQLEQHDFEKAKVTTNSIHSLLEILIQLQAIETDWQVLQGQPITGVPTLAAIKIPGKRGRKPKSLLLQTGIIPSIEVAGSTEKKKRGRKPGSKNKPKLEVEGAPKKKETRGRPRKNATQAPHLTQKDYYRPILEVLRDNKGPMEYTHCRDVVRSRLAPTFQAGDTEIVGGTDTERWAYLIPWARIRLVKAGLMKQDSPRKYWEISNLGLDWLEGKLDITPLQIDKLELPWLVEEETPEEKLLRLRGLKPASE